MKTTTAKTPKIRLKKQAVKSHLRRDMHKLIDEIVAYCLCPSMWPMTQQEQVAFVRRVIYQAKILSDSEEYIAEAVEITVEDLALGS